MEYNKSIAITTATEGNIFPASLLISDVRVWSIPSKVTFCIDEKSLLLSPISSSTELTSSGRISLKEFAPDASLRFSKVSALHQQSKAEAKQE